MHFPVFAKNFRKPWMNLNFILPISKSLGPIGFQGWVVNVIPQNVKKNPKSLHPASYIWSKGQIFYANITEHLKGGAEREEGCK